MSDEKGNKPNEKASDRYLTTGASLDIIRSLWPGGADLDPFHDPERRDPLARILFDLRAGQDAYVLDWADIGIRRVWVNGPYSRGNPARTAERCALYRDRGLELLNLCPASPGSDYWRRWVWPWASAIAWCGRESFRAAVDMFDSEGELRCKAGEVQDQNRTEISLVYLGDEPDRFVELARVLAGWPAQVL